MSAIKIPGDVDLAGRPVVNLPFDLAVQINALQERLEGHNIGFLLLCKRCLNRKGGAYSRSVINGDYGGGNTVRMDCPCTSRRMTRIA